MLADLVEVELVEDSHAAIAAANAQDPVDFVVEEGVHQFLSAALVRAGEVAFDVEEVVSYLHFVAAIFDALLGAEDFVLFGRAGGGDEHHGVAGLEALGMEHLQALSR
jgi:hypothetical protein